MAYYLGIDGGGSKTTCQVGTDDSLLATVTAGPSNLTRVGEARAREALHDAIQRACDTAKIHPRQLHRACIGAAGAGREAIAASVRKITAEIIPGEIEVVGDMQIALEAAFGEGPGVIVIAGTGSIAYGRDAQGRTARAGGWGFVISDEGSAHWIGRAAVSALLRAINQKGNRQLDAADEQNSAAALPLLGKLTSVWRVRSLDEFVRAANANSDFAALFPAILLAAEVGDGLAQGVLTQAGRELAQLAGIVARRLFADDRMRPAETPLAMAGGVFRYSTLVRDVFQNGVRNLDSRLKLTPQVVEPVIGALQMARRGKTPIG